MTIVFIDSQTMRKLNSHFTRRKGLTDVLSFRYPNEPIAGEILVAPAFARQYAKRHKIPYRQELARDVIHGLLHWVGHNDRTLRQQRRMQRMEDELLAQCTERK